jgi:hypothetical protein
MAGLDQSSRTGTIAFVGREYAIPDFEPLGAALENQ